MVPISLHYLAQGEGQGGGEVAFPPHETNADPKRDTDELYNFFLSGMHVTAWWSMRLDEERLGGPSSRQVGVEPVFPIRGGFIVSNMYTEPSLWIGWTQPITLLLPGRFRFRIRIRDGNHKE